MSYAVRNSIILLVVVVLIWIIGWLYLYLSYDRPAAELAEENAALATDLEDYQEQADQYDDVIEQHEQAIRELDNFPKQYVKYEEIDRIYDLIRRYNSGSTYTEFDFSLSGGDPEEGSTGQISIDGRGDFSRLAAFIQTIESEPALVEISSLAINPQGDSEELTKVRYSMNLEVKLAEETSGRYDLLAGSVNRHRWSGHNPFTPLIHDPKSNERGLPDIRGGKLSGMTSDRVWVTKQNGQVVNLRVGDEVYLGRLIHIDTENRKADFRLNVGGILEYETLEFESNTEGE